MIAKGSKGCAPFFALFVVTPGSRPPEKANASMNAGSRFECGDSERVYSESACVSMRFGGVLY